MGFLCCLGRDELSLNLWVEISLSLKSYGDLGHFNIDYVIKFKEKDNNDDNDNDNDHNNNNSNNRNNHGNHIYISIISNNTCSNLYLY